MSNQEIAHKFFHSVKRDAGRAGNLWFSGETIYSYGYHFPIATIVARNELPLAKRNKKRLAELLPSNDNRVLLFTTRGYSNSTSRHISYVRRANPGLPVVWMPYPDNAEKSITELRRDLDSSIRDLAAMRTSGKKESRLNELNTRIQQSNTLVELFGLKKTHKIIPAIVLDADTLAKLEKNKKREELAAVRRRKELERKREIELYSLRASLVDWKNGKNDQHNFAMLDVAFRIRSIDRNGTLEHYVQTSHGVSFPLADGLKFARLLELVVRKNDTSYVWQSPPDSEVMFGEYRLNELRYDSDKKDWLVRAGCHTTYANDVLQFVASLPNELREQQRIDDCLQPLYTWNSVDTSVEV